MRARAAARQLAAPVRPLRCVAPEHAPALHSNTHVSMRWNFIYGCASALEKGARQLAAPAGPLRCAAPERAPALHEMIGVSGHVSFMHGYTSALGKAARLATAPALLSSCTAPAPSPALRGKTCQQRCQSQGLKMQHPESGMRQQDCSRLPVPEKQLSACKAHNCTALASSHATALPNLACGTSLLHAHAGISSPGARPKTLAA